MREGKLEERELTLEHSYSGNSGQGIKKETVNRSSGLSQHGCHILQLHFTNHKTDIFVPIYLSPESISELQAAERVVINY